MIFFRTIPVGHLNIVIIEFSNNILTSYFVSVQQQNGFVGALNDGDLLRDTEAVLYLVTCITRSLQCQTYPACVTMLLNEIRSSTFFSQHLNVFFTKMMTEDSMARLRAFKQPIKV